MEKLTIVYFSLGSNLGDRASHLSAARAQIEKQIGSIQKKSGVYETPPFGFESEDTFYNQCISVETMLLPLEVLAKTQSIEKQLGRTQKTTSKGYSSRIIDIDILYFGSEIFTNSELIIPHSQLRFRKFVLAPLVEIAPNFIDPTTHVTVSQLHFNCPDDSEIVKIH